MPRPPWGTPGIWGGDGTVDAPPDPPYVVPNVVVDGTRTFQTFRAWEATIADHAPFMQQTQYDNLVDDAVAFGITSIRLDASPGQIESVDGTTWVNDDASPTSLNAAGFLWNGSLDGRIQHYVVRFAQRVAAHGEPFELRVSIPGDGARGTAPFWNGPPAEYAEFVATLVAHIQDTYGLHVAWLDARNEPDLGAGTVLTGSKLGQRIAAAGPVLAAAGFTGKISAPSTTDAGHASAYWNAIKAVPGAASYVGQVTYHLYAGNTATTRGEIVAAAGVLPVGLTEWCKATIDDLVSDLVDANVTTWEKFTLDGPLNATDVWPDPLPGVCGQSDQLYYSNPQDASPTPYHLRMLSVLMRPFVRSIRPGATRIGASSKLDVVRPVAFRSPGGSVSVVARTTAATPLKIGGLPAGTYHVAYVVAAASGPQPATAPDVTIVAGQTLVTAIPGPGTVSITP